MKIRATSRRGFSFPEVLFAVIILGIGFIMIAAIFPVALSQSKLTLDETAGSALARAKVAEVQEAINDSNTPAANKPWPIVLMPTTTLNGVGAGAFSVDVVRPVEDYTILGIPKPSRWTSAWSKVAGLELMQNDPRYAAVLLYRRGGHQINPVRPSPVALPTDWSNTAQIYAIVVTCRGTQRLANASPPLTMQGASVSVPARLTPQFDQYDYNFDTLGSSNTPGNYTGTPAVYTAPTYNFVNPNNLSAHQIQVQLQDGGATGPDLIKVLKTPSLGAGTGQNIPDAVAEGTYVVISNDPTNNGGGHTNITGRIYRVGVRRSDLDDGTYLFYELQPGNDMQSNAENTTAAVPAFCVGRERLADGTFIGPSQDVSIYTTYIPVQP